MPRSLHLNGPSDDSDEPNYTVTCDRTTGPQALRLVVSAGSLHIYGGGGKLGRVDLPEPDESDVEAAWDRAVAALPEKVELVYVDRDDQLTDEQIQKAFNGEPPYDDSDYDLWESDQRFNGAWSVMEAHVATDDLDILKQTEDKVDELRFAIEERDESDPFADLIRQTPHKWMRYRVDVETSSTWAADDDEIKQDMQNIAEALGLEQTAEHAALLRELVTEGQAGVLHLLWYGEVGDLIDAAREEGNDVKQTITWENPHLLILDSLGGSGHEVSFSGTVTLPFKRENLKLDARGIGNGYSWSDEIAGMTSDRGTTTVTVTAAAQEASDA